MRDTATNPAMVAPYTKTVMYYGKEIQVPHKAKWIHTDYDGDIYWSNKELRLLAYSFSVVQAGAEYGYVGCFNHTEMSRINWMLSQKRISDLPSITHIAPEKEPTGHPHADLILKYAQIAQYSDKPWEGFEWYGATQWLDCSSCTGFSERIKYRLKPQLVQIQVGQVWESSKSKVKFSVVSTDEYPLSDTKYIGLSHTLDAGLDIPYTLTEDTLRKHFRLVK